MMSGNHIFKVGDTVEVNVGTENYYMGEVLHVHPDATLDIGHGMFFMQKTALKVPVHRVSRFPAESNNDDLSQLFYFVPRRTKKVPKAPKKTRRQLTQREVENRLDTWERVAVRHQRRARDAERREIKLRAEVDEYKERIDQAEKRVEEADAFRELSTRLAYERTLDAIKRAEEAERQVKDLEDLRPKVDAVEGEVKVQDEVRVADEVVDEVVNSVFCGDTFRRLLKFCKTSLK